MESQRRRRKARKESSDSFPKLKAEINVLLEKTDFVEIAILARMTYQMTFIQQCFALKKAMIELFGTPIGEWMLDIFQLLIITQEATTLFD